MNTKHELTQAGYDKKVERLKFLKEVAVPRNIEALKEARAQGDLSENAEYEAARDEQTQIAAEIAELENIIENAIIIQSSDAKITVYFEEDDEDMTFSVVASSLESDPLNGVISKESPLGKAIFDAAFGDRILIEPEKGEEYYIVIKNIEKIK